MSQNHTEVIRRFVAGPINDGRLEELDELFTPDSVFHCALQDDPLIGPGGARGFFSVIRTAYPDLHVTIEDLVTEGDRAAIRIITRGTNTGPMRTYDPTGRRAEFGEMFFFRFENGRIAELWQQLNVITMLRQIGRAPTEEEMKRLQKVLPVLKGVGKIIESFSKLGRPSTPASPSQRTGA
jgi:steroid delta-isomerase-like uncharacterized protein